jgi:hypothetical protein
MEMVSFSDEALETFSPECMESSSIRSMGGVVHLLITAVVETMQGLVGCRVDLNEEDRRLRRQDSLLAHQTERFSPSEYGKTVTDAEIEVQTHSPFCL